MHFISFLDQFLWLVNLIETESRKVVNRKLGREGKEKEKMISKGYNNWRNES
jgi:hypothetical protein